MKLRILVFAFAVSGSVACSGGSPDGAAAPPEPAAPAAPEPVAPAPPAPPPSAAAPSEPAAPAPAAPSAVPAAEPSAAPTAAAPAAPAAKAEVNAKPAPAAPPPSAAAPGTAAPAPSAATPAPTQPAAAAAAPAAAPCGNDDQPDCPLQAWMRKNLDDAVDAGDLKKLAAGFSHLAKMAPDPSWNDGGATGWAGIANSGAAAANSGNMDAARQTCKTCHRSFRSKFKASPFRARPLPN